MALLLAGLTAVTWAWARNQFYIGGDGGYVAIYRGLPGGIGPIALHTVEQSTAITVDSLPDFEAMQVEGTIPTDSLAAAEQVVQRLSERAAQCVALPTTPGCPQTTGTDAVDPAATVSPTATASPAVSGP
jgi:protein phosphatase